MYKNMFGQTFSSESINKPAKPYNPNLDLGRPVWEEEVNDTTGEAAGWLSLFHIEGTDQFIVQYRDFSKRHAINNAVDVKAEKAKALATEKFAERLYIYGDSIKIEIDGLTFTAFAPTQWEKGLDDEVTVDAASHHARPEDWIYDLTDNKVGKFIIDGWKVLNPERFAALPKTPEELEARNRRWAEEYLAAKKASSE